MHSPILLPAMGLVVWTFVMWAWLYATRIPAIVRLKIPMRPTLTKNNLNDALPHDVRWKADNYNHLLEQPTLFYAVAVIAALAGAGEGVNVALAWAYVALRIAHSLVQATVNIITLRFAVFMLSSLVLLALAIRVTLSLV
jgi:hypothetical protein